MSFSANVKKQLCRIVHQCEHCNASELAGILSFAGVKKADGFRVVTENQDVARRLVDLMNQCFKGETPFTINEQSRSYTLLIPPVMFEQVSSYLFLVDGVLQGEESLKKLAPFDCCKTAYIRGAFLGGGSVSNPQKAYHLEFDTRYKVFATSLKDILLSMTYETKLIRRKTRYIVYVKEYEVIADILTEMGAGGAVMHIYNIQIEKEMRNTINRQVNCETANIDKVVKASMKQVEAILKIKKIQGLESLPDTLYQMAKIRLEYPDESLKELSVRLQIGKSGVNHRLNRLLQIAEDLDK